MRRGLFAVALVAFLLPGLAAGQSGAPATTSQVNKRTSAPLVRNITSSIPIGLRQVEGYDSHRITAFQDDISGGTELENLEVIGADGGVFVWALGADPVRVRAGGHVDDDFFGTGAQSIRIWCVDDDFNEVGTVPEGAPPGTRPSFTINLAGALVSATSTEECRHINLARVEFVGTQQVANAGKIFIESDKSSLFITIEKGRGQSTLSAQAVPAPQNWELMDVQVGPESNQEMRLVIEFIPDCTLKGPSFSPVLILYDRKGLASNVSANISGAPGFLPGGSCWLAKAGSVPMASVTFEAGVIRADK